MPKALLTVALQFEQDVVVARQRARHIAGLVGFDVQDQTRIASAVSEMARNAFRYAKGGRVEFSVEGESAPQVLIVMVRDKGPGIANLDEILSGRYRSQTGMGIGLIGVHRLMDRVEIRTAPGAGTEVILNKILPSRAAVITRADVTRIATELASRSPTNPVEELQEQNRELVRTLAELRERQDELLHLNRELEDTNRGVVALYAELDEKADHLRRADEMKSKFLSNMSHEFRTPLNSVRALSRLLLGRIDGELTAEQDKQVRLIAKSAEDLTALVDDLLDLAKIEAGKIEMRPTEFSVGNLFSALRGMLRPLLTGDSVKLTFDDPSSALNLVTDEGKVSQILRNFISNAIKFTEQGEVRVYAEACGDGKLVRFGVQDTGIGISADDQSRIFDEFTQVNNPLQARVKGTGLGLPLCRRLAQLLGGDVKVQSELGVGSTFTATVPAHYSEPTHAITVVEDTTFETGRAAVLFVDDDLETRFVYEKYLRGSIYQPVCVGTLREARAFVRKMRPQAIVLDILLRGEDTWRWMSELKADSATATIPILVISSVEDERKGLALGADGYCLKPISSQTLIERLDSITGQRILIIDDDPASRYLLQKLLSDRRACVIEASDGRSGLAAARRSRPSMIFLDLMLPDLGGEDILTALKADLELRSVPVAIVTSVIVSPEERERLEKRAHVVMQKSDLNFDSARAILESGGIGA
ncbi:MAG TPA: ATP-binding protein [Steroidobacteraceae bacterium]|jgi:signal transduction histidine kinase/DNA-binding response OmpR family regulator